MRSFVRSFRACTAPCRKAAPRMDVRASSRPVNGDTTTTSPTKKQTIPTTITRIRTNMKISKLLTKERWNMFDLFLCSLYMVDSYGQVRYLFSHEQQ